MSLNCFCFPDNTEKQQILKHIRSRNLFFCLKYNILTQLSKQLLARSCGLTNLSIVAALLNSQHQLQEIMLTVFIVNGLHFVLGKLMHFSLFGNCGLILCFKVNFCLIYTCDNGGHCKYQKMGDVNINVKEDYLIYLGLPEGLQSSSCLDFSLWCRLWSWALNCNVTVGLVSSSGYFMGFYWQ